MMMEKVLIGAIGLLVGGLISFYIARYNLQTNQAVESYKEYISGIAEVAQSQRPPVNPQQEATAIARVAAAKANIAIYGDTDVVTALANFHRGAARVTPDDKNFMLTMVAIRKHIMGSDAVLDIDDMKLLFFGAASCVRPVC